MAKSTMKMEYTILKFFLNYFQNGEVEGLTENEIQAIEKFERGIIGFCSHFCVTPKEGTENFSRCYITGMRGETIDVIITVFNPDIKLVNSKEA